MFCDPNTGQVWTWENRLQHIERKGSQVARIPRREEYPYVVAYHLWQRSNAAWTTSMLQAAVEDCAPRDAMFPWWDYDYTPPRRTWALFRDEGAGPCKDWVQAFVLRWLPDSPYILREGVSPGNGNPRTA